MVPASDDDSGASAPMHVYGAVQRATLAGADKVTMRFTSNSTSVAAAENKVGDGHAVWCGFLPVSSSALCVFTMAESLKEAVCNAAGAQLLQAGAAAPAHRPQHA